ncbi:hypothetical protein FOH10_10000 [Nocardia otitidiscaviarum]|uniref:Uncharacterized protein n=1 Tax=Nocardia otitidiscaviarum TaxID=1823 RepID=A0A516NJE3_9NOCA|nr:hypothetical protein [Nocardia otitidiscaviarum]MCP9618898.1 hypothetical protein [Nocardia otitidiscaviarum]QDP79016.1 hypothetical protein FOH10_10000 [Nocardia otitidiscaviarum]
MSEVLSTLSVVQRDEYRYWSSDKRFEHLLDQLMSLDLGAWSVGEVQDALSTLGWKLLPVDPPQAVDRALWRKQIVGWELRPGPRAGFATVMVSNRDPAQAVKLTVNLSSGIDFDMDYNDGPDYAEVAFIQSAWWILLARLGGGPPVWSGPSVRPAVRNWPGLRMVWERPGTSWALGLDSDQVVLELICSATTGSARQEPSPVWHATEPAGSSTLVRRIPGTRWADVHARLTTALCTLCTDIPTLPGQFELRLRSAADPAREVGARNQGNALGIDAPATISSTPADHWITHGWTQQSDKWFQFFYHARFRAAEVAAAAEQMVNALSALEVEPSELEYHGCIDARNRLLRLDLPVFSTDHDSDL